MGTYSSVTRSGATEPFDLQVARGQIAGHTAIFRSAYSNAVVSSGARAIWPRASTYTFPASASTMTLSSSNTGDTTQQVLISGLDSTYAVITEVLTLNGQTAVTSTKSYLRINDMTVVSGAPAGSIYFGTGTVTTGVPANVYGFIAAGENKSAVGVYTVPAGNTLYITGGSAGTSGLAAAQFMTVNFHAVIGGVDYTTAKIFAGSGFQFYPYNPPIAAPEKSDLYDTVLNSATGPDSMAVNFSGYLVKNAD